MLFIQLQSAVYVPTIITRLVNANFRCVQGYLNIISHRRQHTFFLLLTNSQVLDICLDYPQGVGVTHATLPALDDNKGVALGHDLELQCLGNTPLDAAVDILLPVHLGEVGLLLVKVEGVDTAVQVSVPGGRGVTGHHEDGADRAVLGEQTGRLARGGEDNDTTSVEVEGSADCGHSARLDDADRPLDKRAQLLEVLDVWDGVLGLEASYCDVLVHVGNRRTTGEGANGRRLTLAHLPDSLVGVRTLGGLTRQHHAVGAVSDGVSNVADLGTSGPRVLDHALEHLSGADDRLASHVAHGDHLLLSSKHLSSGNLDTEVTTGHHHTVSLLQNLGKVVQTLPVLNLGDDLDVLALLAKDLSDGLDVITAADEGGKDHIDVVLDAEAQVVLVLLGQSGEVNIGVGQVHTLSR